MPEQGENTEDMDWITELPNTTCQNNNGFGVIKAAIGIGHKGATIRSRMLKVTMKNRSLIIQSASKLHKLSAKISSQSIYQS